MLLSPEMVQKLIAKFLVTAALEREQKDVSIGSWSKRKEAGSLLVMGSGLVTTVAKNICIVQTISLCL